MFHARPHLETHSRADNHSAVAGAAYRLGLKLYDRRLQRAFDFRKRVQGDEVVFQTTVAPPGAPSWARDPAELWNRVESAERRKDAQVARDYRLPLPLGLNDADVASMAIEIAQFIAEKLCTPVSIGVHRDAPITAFGEVKTEQQVGCHAHLYFPTRKLLFEEDATRDQQSGGSGFGEKLSFLSNKATSGYFVDTVNEFWAKTANWYTARVGLTADYDHRSYRRQGLKIRPQPRLGEAATALERSGHSTRRGEAVREAWAMGEVYRRVHAERMRRRGPSFSATMGDPPQVVPPAAAAAPHGPNTPPPAPPPAGAASPPAAGGPARTLTERFRELYFAGLEEGAGRPEETIVFRLVVLIERSIGRLRRLGNKLFDIETELKPAVTARLDALADLDQWRAGVREEELAAQAEAQRGLWDRMVKGLGAWMDAPDPIDVKRRADHNTKVDAQLQTRVNVTENKVADLQAQAKPLRKAAVLERTRLKRSLHDLTVGHEAALPQLLIVAWQEEREWIERFMPELLRPEPSHFGDASGRGGRTGPRLTPRKPRGFL